MITNLFIRPVLECVRPVSRPGFTVELRDSLESGQATGASLD